MRIENRLLAELTPYRANAKKHDAAQVANVAESIRQFGFVQPVVVDRDGVIVIWHCRALAAKKLGMVEVPCVLWTTRPTRVRGISTCWPPSCRSWICRRSILSGDFRRN